MNQLSMFTKTETREWEPAGEGVKRKILSYDSGLMMVHVRFVKGAIGVVHTHPHRQVTFVERGSFEVNIGGNKSVLSKGDTFIVVPNLEHGVVALEDGDLLDVFTPAREDFLVPVSKK
jgi:quercetin dioxygenase-like cupin family protein